MPKKIKFMPSTKLAQAKLPPPGPARSYIPEWYKKANRFIGGKLQLREYGINKDLKLCVPFLDALTSGYMVELPADLLIQRDELGVSFFWHEEPKFVELRAKDMAATLPRPAGCDRDLYAWIMHWSFIVPNGYSALVTHPLNRFDLPFVTTSGIMDTDQYPIAGQVPFFLRSDFSGVIPAGTPIIQVIPFKREAWQHQAIDCDEEFLSRVMYSVQRHLYDGYKKLKWTRKEFN